MKTAQEQQETLQEQRRLFYVAITRPTDVLVLSSITSLPRNIAPKMKRDTVGGNRSIWKYDFQPVSHRTWTFKTG